MNIIEDIQASVLKLLVNSLGQLSDGIMLASKEGFTSGKMLDYIYNNKPNGRFLIGKMIDKIYLNHRGWQDIRKRKENLLLSLNEAVNYTLESKNNARICDVASGPARYIIESLVNFKDKDVTAELRDIDERWLDEARQKAQQEGVKVDCKVANALREEDFNFEKTPDIFVASGFYDWFNDKDIVEKSMRYIYNALPNQGYFVFSIQAGHYILGPVNKVFKDFNNHQLKMVVWDKNVIDSILSKTGFKTIAIKSDELGHYPVYLAKKGC